MANYAALTLGAAATFALGLALLWRIGAWHVGQAEALIEDEGLAIGDDALQIAAHRGDQEFHLSFAGRTSFMVLGVSNCRPCAELLDVASRHPATANLRLVYLSDSEEVDVDPHVSAQWEIYRMHDEATVRRQWRAPVSPYFHVIDEIGQVRAKGVANRPDHLDRLLALRPAALDAGSTPFRPVRFTGGST